MNMNTLHFDFELGTREAAKQVFTNFINIGCRFYLGQASKKKNTSSKFSITNAKLLQLIASILL